VSSNTPDPIHRAESIADAAKLDWETKLLREVVDYGARLIQRFVDGRKMGHTEACLVVLTAQSVAMADAVEILISAGTADAARVPTRALFEAQLYAHWILAKDTDHRALCWWAHVKRRERKDTARYVANAPEGKEIEELCRAAGMPLPFFTDVVKQKSATSRLAELDGRAAKAPWAAIKDTREWYQAAGAGSIRDVAREAGQEHLYMFFYKLLCRDVHSSNVERWLEFDGVRGQVQGIRTLRGIRMLLQFALPLLFQLYETIIDRLLPAERTAYRQLRLAWGPCLSKIRDVDYRDPAPPAEAAARSAPAAKLDTANPPRAT
jgi:hypothetical protein